tara:strand:- start:48 stop:929 length:882 start_codon:yes stop_codon:yes gene_type:complete
MITPKKPIVSICCSGIRPNNWMKIYRSVGKNITVDFELVFCGPFAPDYELPKNLRYIKSDVKPSQCWEIAYRNAIGDFVMHFGDDTLFTVESPLDKLYKLFKEQSNEKMIVSCKQFWNGKPIPDVGNRLINGNPLSPYVPFSGLMTRKLYNEMGGLDINFIAVISDLDLAMRIYRAGGDIIMSDVGLDEDRENASEGSSLCVEYYEYDMGYLRTLWTDKDEVLNKRSKPFEPYKDKDLYTKSQGPRGRWRGNGFFLYEKIVDSPRVLKKMGRGILKPTMYFNYAARIIKNLLR